MNLRNISVFDADACIMMGKPLSDGYSQMSELVLYFDENYIHEMVYKEIKSTIQKNHLDYLIEQELVCVINDSMILEFLVDAIKDEYIACNFFVASIRSNLLNMEGDDKEKLEQMYRQVINNQYMNVRDLLIDLFNIENRIDSDTNCGEFKTSVLIECLNFLGLAEINFFVSNDKQARSLIVRKYEESINTISPIATFVLFKETNSMNETRARAYLNNIGKKGINERIKVINSRGEFVTKNYLDIFNDIYDNNIDISVTIDGYIKYN